MVAALRCPDEIIRDLLSNIETGGGDVGEQKRKVEAELRRSDGKERWIADLYRRDLFRLEVLESQMAKPMLLRAELELKLKELSGQGQLAEEASEIEGRVRAYCARLCQELDELDFSGKRQVLAAFGVQVTATKRYWSMTGLIDPWFMVVEQASICDLMTPHPEVAIWSREKVPPCWWFTPTWTWKTTPNSTPGTTRNTCRSE